MKIETKIIAIPKKRLKPLSPEQEKVLSETIVKTIEQKMWFDFQRELTDPYGIFENYCQFFGHDYDYIFFEGEIACRRCGALPESA